MILYQNDYKGKYFILSDEDDDMYGSWGTIDSSELTDDYLDEHVETCSYYGIPAYIGKDKELRERVDKLYKKYNN